MLLPLIDWLAQVRNLDSLLPEELVIEEVEKTLSKKSVDRICCL